MTTTGRFPAPELERLESARIVGVRSGSRHRFTSVWVVVVEGRVFIRSWSDKPTGWYRAFLEEPRGSIALGGRTLGVRGRQVRSERIRSAVTQTYAAKYNTKASGKWVRGFAEEHREATTLELVPTANRRAARRRE